MYNIIFCDTVYVKDIFISTYSYRGPTLTPIHLRMMSMDVKFTALTQHKINIVIQHSKLQTIICFSQQQNSLNIDKRLHEYDSKQKQQIEHVGRVKLECYVILKDVKITAAQTSSVLLKQIQLQAKRWSQKTKRGRIAAKILMEIEVRLQKTSRQMTGNKVREN